MIDFTVVPGHFGTLFVWISTIVNALYMKRGFRVCRMSRKHYFGAADEVELKYVNR